MEVLSGTRGIKKKRGVGRDQHITKRPAHTHSPTPGMGPGVGWVGAARGGAREMLAPGIYRQLRSFGTQAHQRRAPPFPPNLRRHIAARGPSAAHRPGHLPRARPLLGHIQPAPQLPQAFGNPVSAPRPPRLHRHRTQAARMQQPRACSAWARASLPPAGAGQGWGHPSTPNKMTNKRKQTKTEDSPLPRPQEGAEGGGVEGGRREQACSLGQIFCCFIRFSVNQLEFARTGVRGVRGGVSKRARAREELERTGIASCPGLHFAVIICTNSS